MEKQPREKGVFRLIPVLDLKDGVVVHGIRGEREKYKPIESVLTPSAEFAAVVDAFVTQLELREFYVADLDAITSGLKKDHLGLLARLQSTRKNSDVPLSFMVDAGVFDVAGVGRVLNAGADRVVIGTETLPSLAVLEEIIAIYGSERLVVSIDTRDACIISPSPALACLTPFQAIKKFQALGIWQFILLELSKVGTGAGLNKFLIKECLAVLEQEQKSVGSLLLGGGVSGYEDLCWLAESGVAGALVATALHNGRINRRRVEEIRIMSL